MRAAALLVLLLGGCSLAYRPGDAEFARELKRVADGFEYMKQRDVAELTRRSADVARDERWIAEQQKTTTAIERLTDTLTRERSTPTPSTYPFSNR